MSNSAIQLQPGADGQRGAAADRNVIINGQFDIWQRGTSFSGPTGFPPTGVIFTADRWNSSGSGGAPAVPIGDVTVNQIDRITFDPGQTDVPETPTFYLQRQVIIVGGGTTDASILGVFIEDVRTFNAQKATMSFWAKGNISGDLAVNFVQRFGAGGSPAVLTSEQFFSVTPTWQKYVLVFDVPSIAGKTIGTTADHLQIRFYSYAGNAVFASGLPVDYTGEFCITNVQFELGEEATRYEDRSVADEFAASQRYYQQSYNEGVSAGAFPFSPGPEVWEASGGSSGETTISFPTQMRVAPSMIFFDWDTGVPFVATEHTPGPLPSPSVFGTTVVTPNLISRRGFDYHYPNAIISGIYAMHWTADAELV